MASVPMAGKRGLPGGQGMVFEKVGDFQAYLEDLAWLSWRPRFLTLHHCGEPSLRTWQGYQVRKPPISDAQWIRNLASYYGNTMGWSSCPHFFVTPRHFCVVSPPISRGVHA